MTARRLAMIVATGVATLAVLHYQRGLPWKLAGIAGVAVAVLGVMALRTVDKLREVWRDPGGRGRDGGDAD